MGAIILNLLAEDQLAQQAEARDPLKKVLAVGVGLLSICVGVGVVVGQMAEKKGFEVQKLKKQLDSVQTLQDPDDGLDTKGVKAMVDDLVALNKSRLVFGPQMALIKDIVPATVQLSQISFSIVSVTPPAPPPTEDVVSGKPKRVPTPKPVTHLKAILDGRAVCARPELEVDQFIKSIGEHPVLGAMINDVRLRSIAKEPNSTDPNNPAPPSAIFVIECEYKERK